MADKDCVFCKGTGKMLVDGPEPFVEPGVLVRCWCKDALVISEKRCFVYCGDDLCNCEAGPNGTDGLLRTLPHIPRNAGGAESSSVALGNAPGAQAGGGADPLEAARQIVAEELTDR